jgi:hypothetical protein
LTPKVCHSEEMAANPASDAIRLMPITPILSKQPSLKVCSCRYDCSCKYEPKKPLPKYQNPPNHAASPQNSSTHAILRCPFCPLFACSPVFETTECISKAGVTTIRRKSSEGSVSLRASVRVAGFTVLAISQKMSSARTADRAMFVEKMMLASERVLGCRVLNSDDFARDATLEMGAPSWCALRSWADSSGNSFCDTATATKRKVSRKGRDEIIVFIGLLRAMYSGTHSSQSSSRGGSIGLSGSFGSGGGWWW